MADQSVLSVQTNSQPVLRRLLPATSTQRYNLRPRRHSFSLTQQESRAVAGNPRDAAVIFDP